MADTKTREIDFSAPDSESKRFQNLMGLTAEGSVKRILYGSATINPTGVADGAGVTVSMTVTGAALGDIAIVSAGVDLVDFTISAYVQGADTVEIRLQNESGSSVNLASTTFRALVFDVT